MSILSGKIQLTRRDFLLASLLSAAAFNAPADAWARLASDEDGANRCSISVAGDTIAVIDRMTGEKVLIQLDRAAKAATIVYSDGTVSQAYMDSSGTLYVDGEIVLQSDALGEATTSAMSMLSVPSGYVPLVTHRYSASTYDAYINTVSFIASLLVGLGLSELIPGGGGDIAGSVASKLVEMYYSGLPRGYVELKQYYHPTTYYVYTVVSLYQNSDYTGLVKRWEYGPSRPV